MSISFTEQQKNAIHARGNALLVSAAAGSGKTAVLVERVLRRISEEGKEIDRMMIMTFTTAAAEEMRRKIKKALEEKIRNGGGNDHLMRQSALVDSARIGTVHSICLDLITRHFKDLDLDPRCRLLDDMMQQELADQGAEALLEALYTQPTAQEQEFLDCFATGRNDDELKNVLLQGLAFLEDLPLAEHYIERALSPYRRTEEGLFACFLEDGLFRYLTDRVGELLAEYDKMMEEIQRSPYLSSFPLLLAFLEEECRPVRALSEVLEQRNYTAWREALGAISFGTLTTSKYLEKDADPVEKEKLTKLRNRFKESVMKFAKLFPLTEEEELERIRRQGSLLETYFTLCNRLKNQLAQDRRRNGWITYGDMEQLTVQLLTTPESTPEAPVPSPLALELRQDYDEIVVDEFQDTNLTQDLIFRCLSRDGTNLFMVGDLKQSIYRFRGAEPTLFDEKRRVSAPFTQNELTAPTVLELTSNFRSHPSVLRFCNQVFRGIMSPELGGVTYDEREELVNGRDFLQPDTHQNELHWLLPQPDEQEHRVDKKTRAARYTAQLIKKAVEGKEQILLPDKTKRAVTYGDFAILLRTTKGKADLFERELRRLNIPVTNQNPGEQFFDLPEVQDLLAYLMVLNNPYDDIAMVSLLYSPFFSFTVGELAALRDKNHSLYDNLREAAAGGNQRASDICGQIEIFRDHANELYVYDLLHRIFRETNIFTHYAGEPNGAEKIANLELVAEDARLFEQEGYRGLYAFVEHLRISNNKTQSGARTENSADSVRIMSIHKSKGLEYPICILPDSDREMRDQDLSRPILFHTRYGAAVDHYDPAVFVKLPSLAKTVLKDQIRMDGLGEEERVLYVGLTRAVYKNILLISPSVKQGRKWLEEGKPFKGVLPRWLLGGGVPSFARWLMYLLGYVAEGAPLRAYCGISEPWGELPTMDLQVQCVIPEEEQGKPIAEQTAPTPFNTQAFRKRLDWEYPHLGSLGLPAKLSVSELKGMREADPEAEGLLEEQVRMQKPRFASEFKARGNEVGNALHQALQFSNFNALYEDPQKELNRLAEARFITPAQRELIPLEKVRRFTQSPLFRELLEADYYSKEERFLFPMEAKELFGPTAEGEVLIQGVLDCYWVKNGQGVILDYKTDGVSKEEELIHRYRTQMELYEEALKRMKGITVARKIIYSFSLGKAIVL